MEIDDKPINFDVLEMRGISDKPKKVIKNKSSEDKELDGLFQELKEFKKHKDEEEEKKKKGFMSKYQDSRQFKDLMKKHSDYLRKLKKKREDDIKKLNIEDKKKLLKIEEKSQIMVNHFQSDHKFLKRVDRLKWYNFIKRIKRRLKIQILVVIHRPDNNDIIRYFPLEKGHIIDIDGHKYLFNPAHFRYIGSQPVLYFYWGNPFAKLVYVDDNYSEPTISSEAFSEVLTSKHVIDAVKGSEKKMGIVWFIIIIILMVILMVLGLINTVGVSQITKALNI